MNWGSVVTRRRCSARWTKPGSSLNRATDRTEGDIYSRIFDRNTNIRTDNNRLFFNVEGLSSDPKLETAMSMLIIASAMAERASGKAVSRV